MDRGCHDGRDKLEFDMSTTRGNEMSSDSEDEGSWAGTFPMEFIVRGMGMGFSLFGEL